MSAAVTWASAGETVYVPAIDGRLEPVMLWKRCESPAPGYWCERCGRLLGNAGELVTHLADAPDAQHHVAVWCPMHRGDRGRWEAADDAQMRALTGVAV
jgi:hypothetical protein